MKSTDVILMIALAAALATWGLAQLVMGLFQRDRKRLHERLTARPQGGPSQLLAQSSQAQAKLKDAPDGATGSAWARSLQHTLAYAYPDARFSRFAMLMGAMAVVGFLALWFIMQSPLFGVAGGAAGGYLPVMWINRQRHARQRQIAAQLPDALDFLCRVLRAGHSLSSGIQMMGDELPSPIGNEFRRCHEQHSLGQSLETALRDLAGRVEDSDVAFFVTAVLIQRQTGGDLSEVLNNLSSMVRGRIRLQQHVKAITAEGRVTGYILTAFPAVMFVICYILRPEYMAPLVKTSLGQMLMLATVAFQAMGLFCIRKIVTVKV